MCEAENFREHRVDREPLFMRFDGERDRVRLRNPALIALASQMGDVAGPFDGDFLGAAKALGERTFKTVGGVEGLKQLGARALGALRGAPAVPQQPQTGGAPGFEFLPYVQRALQGLGHPDLGGIGVEGLQGLLLGAVPDAGYVGYANYAVGEAGETGGWWDRLRGAFGGAAPEAPAAPAAPPPDESPQDDPTSFEQPVPRDGPRRALTKATYKVMAGDWPAKIAQKLGASRRPRWLAELYAANPHKTTLGGNWRLLAPGETINLPDEWSHPAVPSGDVGDPLLGDDFANRHHDLLRAPRGPSRDAQIVDAVADHLKGATQGRMEARDDCFRKVLTAARAMYGHAFDPEHLATGNPFVIFTHGMAPASARTLCDALISGQDPLGIFRQLDQEHRAHLVDECSRIAAAVLREGGAERPRERVDVPALDDEHVEVAGPMPEEERPAPLYHLSLPPLHPRAFAALLELVPALQMHPDAVEAEIAGWRGQSADTSGVDAATQEYVALPGETLRSIAEKLVRDGDRWIELDACNPARRQGDPRLRIPPNWFAYIPYAAPSDAIEALAHNPILKRIMAGEDVETGDIEHDRAALEGLHHNPLFRRALLSGAAVDGTTLHGLEARGEVRRDFAVPRRNRAGEIAAAVIGGPLVAAGEALAGVFHPHAIRRNPFLRHVVNGWGGRRMHRGWRGRWDTGWEGDREGHHRGLLDHHRGLLDHLEHHRGLLDHHRGPFNHHRWETGEAGDPDTGDPGSDEAALVGLRTDPRLRRVLIDGGMVNGVSLRGLLRRRRLHAGWADVVRFPALRRVMGLEVKRARHGRRGRLSLRSGNAARTARTCAGRFADRGMHDGLESYEHRSALRISEDARMNGPHRMGPDIVALSFVLRADPRVERTEIQKPSIWNAVDIPYLKVIVRAGAPADDPSPWDLSALDTPVTPSPDTGEAGAPERKYVAVGRETARTIAAHHSALGRANWADELREANPGGIGSDRSDAGDVLTIPAPWPVERTYVVQKGDYAQAIARKCGGLDRPNWWNELAKANPQKEVVNTSAGPTWSELLAGEVLHVPEEWTAFEAGEAGAPARRRTAAHGGRRSEPQRSRWTRPRWTRPRWTQPRRWRW